MGFSGRIKNLNRSSNLQLLYPETLKFCRQIYFRRAAIGSY
mgnify:CR=1 FL=1